MASTKAEDFVSARRALKARRMVESAERGSPAYSVDEVDVLKLAIWAAGIVLPWAVIIIAARWVATVLT
jgi:hypothetical protein